MTYKYREFDLFTAKDIRSMVEHDLDKALELFADSFVVTYKIQHDIIQLSNIIDSKNEELSQALNLCVKCLKLVETTVQNRK